MKEEEGKGRGMHGSARGAGGDGGGGRSDLTRLAGRNKLATRALVPSVPLAIGACRFLSRTMRRFYRADRLLPPPTRTSIDLLFCLPQQPRSPWPDFRFHGGARRIPPCARSPFPGLFFRFHESQTYIHVRMSCTINARDRRESRQLSRFLGPAIVFPAVPRARPRARDGG